MFFVSVFSSGCGTQTILVREDTPVQLRQNVKNVKVWVFDSNGSKVESVVILPAGWYCLADPGE